MDYWTFYEGKFNKLSVKELAAKVSLPRDIPVSSYSNNLKARLWSARLSTGVFGLTSCVAGNRGPKDCSEVILGIGDEGLNKLVALGFIPCPVCHPEKVDGFWDAVKEAVSQRYGITSLEMFVDKDVLPFDSRRVEWEEILPVVEGVPSRIYLPRNLANDDLLAFSERFERIGFKLPAVGYYDPEAPGRFVEYNINH